jgi:CheY-like chemotaxis protein
MKILLIEDSKFQRIANGRALVKAGYDVIYAGDGDEGLRIARENIPDLILLDMMLPKLSGLDLLRALKNDVLAADIPVIVLSGLGQANEAKLLKEGATAFFGEIRNITGERFITPNSCSWESARRSQSVNVASNFAVQCQAAFSE